MKLFLNAIYLAWNETRARYRKSVLGPLWLTLGNLVGILGLSIVWANLLKEEMRTFVPSLTIGMIVWQLVAGAIGEGAATFTRQAVVIRNVALPLWFFVVRAMSRQIINFIHNLLIIVAVVIYFDFPMTWTTVMALPGVILTIANLSWLMFVLGMIGARFRDVEFIIASLLPLLFFISPVIFRPDRLPVGMEIIWCNPLSYFIEAVRAPFLGSVPDMTTYIMLLAMLAAGTYLGLWLNRTRGKRVAFWV